MQGSTTLENHEIIPEFEARDAAPYTSGPHEPSGGGGSAFDTMACSDAPDGGGRLVAALFGPYDGPITFEVSGKTIRAGGTDDQTSVVELLREHNGDARVSPLTVSGVHFLFRGMNDVDENAFMDRAPMPTVALYRDRQMILCFTLDIPASPAEAKPVADAFDMRSLDECIPLPPTGGWKVVHCDADNYFTLSDLGATVSKPNDASAAIGTYGDARVVSPYNPADYTQEVTVTFGGKRDSKNWKPQTMQTCAFYAELCKHRVGHKDGPAFVLADMVAGQRLKTAVKTLWGVGLDIDTGKSSDAVDDAMLKLGCSGVRYTTHSHAKTSTDFNKDRITKFAAGGETDHDLIRRFLTEVEHWDASIVDSAEYAGTDHTDKGIVVRVSHAPMPKHRVVYLFKEPFVIADEGRTQAEAMKKWAMVPTALAKLMGVPSDASCVDPSRLYYFPRHEEGQPFEIRLFGGGYFDWRTLQLEDPFEKLVEEFGKIGGKSVTEAGKKLGKWSSTRSTGFQIADVVSDHAHDKIRGDGLQGFDIECPFDENHSNAGDPDDRACFIVNAGEGSSEIFTISCRHETCRNKTNLDMLGKMLTDEWFGEDVLGDEQYNALAPEDGDYEKSAQRDAAKNVLVLQDKITALRHGGPLAETDEVLTLLASVSDPLIVEEHLESIKRATNSTMKVLRDKLKFEQKANRRNVSQEAHKRPPLVTNAQEVVALKGIEGRFPLPSSAYGSFGYRMFEARPWLFRFDQSPDSQGGGDWERLCTAFHASTGVIYQDRGGVRGNRVEILDEDGYTESLDIEARLAVEGYGVGLRARLREASVAWTDAGEKFLVAHFKQISPANPISIYDQPGWHGTAFLTSWGEAINTNLPIELSRDHRPTGDQIAGTLEGWQAATEAAFESGVLHFQVGPLTGLASVLLDLADLPSMVLCYSGASTQGKSTASQQGAAVWGDPEPKKGLFGTFNSTLRATEGLLQLGSGNYYSFDEARMIDGRDLQTFVFKATSDSGADRLNRNADLKRARGWKVFLTISTETPLFEKIKKSGDQATTGLATRSLDINVDGARKLAPEEMARLDGFRKNYGHAGPIFVREVVSLGYAAEPDKLAAEIEKLVKELIGPDGAPQLRRAARIVAVLWKSGIIAQSAGLVPADVDLKAICERVWSKALESDTAPAVADDRAIQTLFESLLTRRGVDIPDDALAENRAAVAWRMEDFRGHGNVYIVPYSNLAELSGGALGAKALSRELAKRGMLVLPSQRKKKSNSWDSVPGIGKIRSLVVRASVVESYDAVEVEVDNAVEGDDPDESGEGREGGK